MKANSVKELFALVEGAVTVHGNDVTITDEAKLREQMDAVVYTAVFGDALVRDTARWLIWELGQHLGVYPASIHELYMAIGRGDVPANFTVPAMNVRAMNYTMSRAIFRAANKHNAGAIIFEIARSEMGYTDQRPSEYVTAVIAAAIKEGFRGPIFIQGDHFQISASRYGKDAEAEVQAVKDLMVEAVEAGFYNIDIDTSTLVDLSFPTLDEQQKLNYTLCAQLTQYVREIEPEGVTISLGGEIGEVGHKNSTVEELHAFMQGYKRVVGAAAGISKISVQTGTSHGGVVLPDGTLADVKVDFDTLRDLSQVARDDYGMGGAVQHGASTLPAEAFNKFPEIGTVEIHLATNFQNIIYDNLPEMVVDTAYNYVLSNHQNEWKSSQTEEQFIYSTRKKAIGPLKQMWWDLGADVQEQVGSVLQEQFEFLFDKLNVKNTHGVANEVTTRVVMHRARPTEAAAEVEAEDVGDLAD
ncbi:MAG: class II fructose-bisphosphate aldolase [Ardenticatenaceae bacterium]|nr:class II fructose-bisphosphate aldolase [Ardenticatenaceae bacterium]